MKVLERGVIGTETKQATPAPYSARRGFTASAAKINLRDRNETQDVVNTRSANAEWQGKAWDHFDTIGEVAFAFGLVASVMSRIRLFPAVITDPDSPPAPLVDAVSIERPAGEDDADAVHKANRGIDPRLAVQARDKFFQVVKPKHVPEIMRSFALNISVPGECYLAEYDGRWHCKSTDELRVETDGVPKLRKRTGSTPRDLPKETVIGRVWRHHPRYSGDPWSSMKALSDDCEELRLLSRVIRSNSRARLNAGILFVPDEVVVASQTPTDDQEIAEAEEDSFEKELYAALVGPVDDEANGNTVVPLLLRGPGELADKIKHIELARKIDEFLVARADRTLERIMQGIDVPKDTVSGLANVKYSNAIQIDESLYKAHVEPLALLIADAVTDIIWHPLLRALEWDQADIDRCVIWYDPSEVTTRPNRAEDAQALYDANELSGSALRAARGFSETDKPTEEELATKVALAGMVPPELMMVLFQHAFPTVLKKIGTAAGAAETLPDTLQQTLAGTEMPNTDPGLEPTVPEGPPVAQPTPTAPAAEEAPPEGPA